MNIRNGQTNMQFFHISENPLLHENILLPRIPDNTLTISGNEENQTARACFAPSVDQCLLAMCNGYGTYYVYAPDDYGKLKVVEDTRNYVPDACWTQEIWSTTPVKLKRIGQINVFDHPEWEGRFDLRHPVNGRRYGEVMSWTWTSL